MDVVNVIVFTVNILIGFVLTFVLGYLFAERRYKTFRPSKDEENISDTEKKKHERLKAEDEAFTTLMGYNIETAYGIKKEGK